MLVPDFARSFATFTIAGVNNARIQIEATCRYFAAGDDEGELVVLVASCKGEDTHSTGPDLFLMPNYDFCAIFGASEYQIIRSFASCEVDRAGIEAGITAERFSAVRVDLQLTEADPCLDNTALLHATLDNRPLVGETELWDEANGARAVLQYPVKTMNVNPAPDIFQVDTGPVLVPDFTVSPTPSILRFAQAFIVYNTFDRAEFVVQAPTEITPNVHTPHYSQIRHFAARNSILALP